MASFTSWQGQRDGWKGETQAHKHFALNRLFEFLKHYLELTLSTLSGRNLVKTANARSKQAYDVDLHVVEPFDKLMHPTLHRHRRYRANGQLRDSISERPCLGGTAWPGGQGAGLCRILYGEEHPWPVADHRRGPSRTLKGIRGCGNSTQELTPG